MTNYIGTNMAKGLRIIELGNLGCRGFGQTSQGDEYDVRFANSGLGIQAQYDKKLRAEIEAAGNRAVETSKLFDHIHGRKRGQPRVFVAGPDLLADPCSQEVEIVTVRPEPLFI